MSTFRIQSWTVRADLPDETYVVAAVITSIGSISKTELYEFPVEGRYDTLTPEFEAAVEAELREAGVLS
jgi:hypothetical protein